tara:strand:- start:1079 stop:1255 length:177 start_codon:yes stop_codon:yes gene_type:complete
MKARQNMKVFSVLKNRATICTVTLLVIGLVTDQAILAQPEWDRPIGLHQLLRTGRQSK